MVILFLNVEMFKSRKRHASEPASTMSPKRQRIVLTLEKKMDLIQQFENGSYSQGELAVKFGVDRSLFFKRN